MGTAVAINSEPARQAVTLRGILSSPDYAARFREVLGERAAQFTSSILSLGSTMRDVEPNSIVQSAMIAATLDLPVNKNLGFAWIVPYRAGNGPKVAQFQMGYKGYIQLALRTSQYERMNAKAINAEAFGGYDDVGEPRILWENLDETKPAVGYACAWKLVNGFTKVCYWTKEKVEAHARRYSQAFKSGRKDTPWVTNWDKMALKTVLKNELATWGILSVELQRALEVDQAVVSAAGELTHIDNGDNHSAGALTLDDIAAQPDTDQTDEEPVAGPPPSKPNGNGGVKPQPASSRIPHGRDSMAWPAFAEQFERVGNNIALEAKDKLGWVNVPFDKLNARQLTELTAELTTIAIRDPAFSREEESNVPE